MLDKYYTKPSIVEECINAIGDLSIYDSILEPSAGAGAFSNQLVKNNIIALDIEPEGSNIIKQDFLTWNYKKNIKYLVLGNPPYGRNASLAIKFFNRSANFADTIAFILPKTFKKISIQNKLNLFFHLDKEIELPNNSFLQQGRDFSVKCIFQIWKKKNFKREKITLKIIHKDFTFTTKEYANFSIRRVGALAGKVNKSLNFADSSNYFIKAKEDVYFKLDSIYSQLKEVANNTVANPSLSKGELIKIYEENYG